jgi:hypothetical protein
MSANGMVRPCSCPSEKLNESIRFPLFTQQRTSPRYFDMSVSCQDRKSRFMVQSKGYQTRTTRFCGAIPRPIAGRLAIAYEEALAEIELANSFSAANAGPPTSPPEALQRPGTT